MLNRSRRLQLAILLSIVFAGGPAAAATITRADIATTTVASDTVVVSGYRTPGDLGAGAVYSSVGATPDGLEAVRDANGTWFNLVAADEVNVGWFGAYGDDGRQAITAQDIAANPRWRGVYEAGTTWDTVATNEAILAAFAGGSTHGHTVWNSLSGRRVHNRTLAVPTAMYGINRQLLLVGAFIDIEFASRGATWDWKGPTSQSMLFTDSIAYAYIKNISLSSSQVATYGEAAPLWDMDHDRAFGGLSTQQVTIVNATIRLSYNGRGVAISPSGGGAQGDTIVWINPLFVGVAPDHCLSVGGANALSITILGGDFQGCTHDAIHEVLGSVYVYGTSFQDQATGLNFTPVISQFTTFGADLHAYFGEGPTGVNKFQDVRSESDVPVNCEPGAFCDVEDVQSAAASSYNWFANYPYALGTTISRVGSQGRTLMVVDDNGDGGWRPVGAGSSACTVQDPAGALTPGRWAGYVLFVRNDGGLTEHHIIASNTAGAITLHSDDCLHAMAARNPTRLFHIGGDTGAAPPAWDSIKPGSSSHVWGAGSLQGFSTTVGSKVVKAASDVTSRIDVGDYVVIPNADRLGVKAVLPAALIGRVVAKDALSVTLDRPAGASASFVYGYWGAPLADKQIRYIDLDFNAISGAQSVSNSFTAQGRTFRLGSISNYSGGRPDWRRTAEYPPQNPPINQLYGSLEHVLAPALTPAPRIDVTAALASGDDVTLAPSGDTVLDAPVPPPGAAREFNLQIDAKAGAPRTVTFGANFRSAGTLSVGGVADAKYVMRFVSDGATWNEASRSGPLTAASR